ncbi:MAG: L-seryl-tRNA(Sec) selenium transferase [Tissierellia bacterium]|nr:L-seryl-tRNA(Sec) selenium transferase [Tissierellia bacterium]
MIDDRNPYRLLPKVDELLEDEKIGELLDSTPRRIVVESIREELDILRGDIKALSLNEEQILDRKYGLVKSIIDRTHRKHAPKLRRVVNATGTVIHTNIGRSLIGERVMDNIRDISMNYSNLEYDLDMGTRGSRYSHLEDILVEITGGEAAMVVNNNAAAVMLVLSTLARDMEVIVSRGELIEIGGSFRVPDVMEQSGARLVAVGTTNKTHLEDFQRAITEETRALLKVHTSNYRILGFTSAVSAGELSQLSREYGIPLIEDLGSGVLIDLSKYGLEYEPTVQDSIDSGVDIVTFSGDKLLGGPQAGIIVGKRKYIEDMKKNPLTRAFRVDKFTISALEATLRLYLDEPTAIEEIPTLKMLAMNMDEIGEKAQKLYDILIDGVGDRGLNLDMVEDYSQVGGGSLPLEKLPTKCIRISSDSISISELEKGLRQAEIPIIARVYRDELYMDLRTIMEGEYEIIMKGLQYSLSKIGGAIL